MTTQKELKSRFKDALGYIWNDDKMINYIVKKTAYVVELNDRSFLPIDKPDIKKNFCFGYGYGGCYDSYEEAEEVVSNVEKSEAYFVTKNLEELNEIIYNLNYDQLTPYIKSKYIGKSGSEVIKHLEFLSPCDEEIRLHQSKEQNLIKLTEEDVKKVLDGYIAVKEQFKKRLATYLKRYGLSKINVWSYWADE